MKKLMMIAALVLMSTGAFAQAAGKMAVGATLTDLLDSDSRIGFGGKFQYGINENFRAEADFKFYPKKWENTCWNANLNFQYVIPVADKFNVYPIAGVGLFGMSFSDGDDSETAFVFHGGAGAEYFLSDNLKLYFDAVYQYGKKDGWAICDNPLLSLGIAYAF